MRLNSLPFKTFVKRQLSKLVITFFTESFPTKANKHLVKVKSFQVNFSTIFTRPFLKKYQSYKLTCFHCFLFPFSYARLTKLRVTFLFTPLWSISIGRVRILLEVHSVSFGIELWSTIMLPTETIIVIIIIIILIIIIIIIIIMTMTMTMIIIIVKLCLFLCLHLTYSIVLECCFNLQFKNS